MKWLGGASNLLAFEDEGEWISTRLGQAAVRGSLPLKTAAGVAQLMRDLLSIDEKDEMLLRFSSLDILLLTELMTTRQVLRKPFSEAMAVQVDDWASRDETKSVLFQNWIRGQKGFSKASEIFGSLGIELGSKATTKDETARKIGYQAMLRAIMLWQRVKRALQRMQGMSLRLMNLIAWCSPLGPVFLRLRSSNSGGSKSSPAQGTMRRLEEAGISDVEKLRACTLADLVKIGVRKELAGQIITFLRRR